MQQHFASLAALLMSLAAVPVAAQEWPRFRGPNGSGLSNATTVPVTWSDEDYAWRVDLPGMGNSSPVLWKGQLYVNCESDSGRTRILEKRDARTGKLQWRQEFGSSSHRTHKFNTYASSTPCVDEHHVYLAWGTPKELRLAAVDHSGQLVWQSESLGPVKGGHGFATSPIVHDNLVVIARDTEGKGDSALIALDRKTGQTVWTVPRQGGRLNYSTPCVFQPQGRGAQLVFVAWPIGVTGIDAASGKRAWEIAAFSTEQGERAIASPVVHNDMIFATCAFTSSPKHLVALKPGPSGAPDDMEEVWRVDNASVPHIPSLIVYDGRLYAWSDQGICTCYEAETGRRIWQKRVGGRFFGSPVCVDGRLYCVDDAGICVVIATGDTYKVLARNDLGEPCRATPAVANGMMYLRTISGLAAIGTYRGAGEIEE
ncbi:MAG: PQQ-binding-like beta-propeller repeat protein [Maioricimonas sp. JB045]|uniref:outer membrane protein assembly factor BamB family protein n=1 Tax=Maioricimonas sp. JC845 TaxID=3232138 RepID=UPI0034578296